MKKNRKLIFIIIIIFLIIISLLVYFFKFKLANKQIYGLIVNHHLFAANLIDQTFSEAKYQHPDVVVLISPNHFNFGKYPLLTAKKTWPTKNGDLPANEIVITSLLKNSDLNIEDPIFEKEHGIFNIIPYINKYFPDTTIIPIIVKETISNEDLDKFTQILNETLPENSLIIGSFDFSHYKIEAVADQNDAKSIIILKNLDYLNTTGLDIDSTKGLRLVLEYLSLRQANQYQLIAHSSSAKITNNPTTKENTSYINGIFTKK